MTNPVTLIQRLHQHRAWVNQNLLAAASVLTDEQLRRSFQIGHGSIWMSLVHLYAAEFVWLDALNGHERSLVPGDLPGHLPGNQLGVGGIASFDELRQKWLELQQRWDRYLFELLPGSLDEPVFRVSSNGQRSCTSRSDVLLHVCTHAKHHTAQVVNMFRQIGVEKLPETMLISMARQEGSKTP